MDTKPATENRFHFKVTVPSAYPVLLHPDVVRDAILIVNEGSQAVRIGHSGTVNTIGTFLAGSATHFDNYSRDEWWAQAVTASGSVSGFAVL